MNEFDVKVHLPVIVTISDAVTRSVMRPRERPTPLAGLLLYRQSEESEGQADDSALHIDVAFEANTYPVSRTLEATGELFVASHLTKRLAAYESVYRRKGAVAGMFAVAPSSGPLPYHESALLRLRAQLRLSPPPAILLLFHPDVAARVLAQDQGRDQPGGDDVGDVGRLPFSVYRLAGPGGPLAKLPYSIEMTAATRAGLSDISQELSRGLLQKAAAAADQSHRAAAARSGGAPAEQAPSSEAEEKELLQLKTQLDAVKMLKLHLSTVLAFLRDGLPDALRPGSTRPDDPALLAAELGPYRDATASVAELGLHHLPPLLCHNDALQASLSDVHSSISLLEATLGKVEEVSLQMSTQATAPLIAKRAHEKTTGRRLF